MSEFRIKESIKLCEKYYYTKHESGLDVYIIPKKHKKAFALFSTRYGSVHSVFRTGDEREFTAVPDGVAHFLEHKLFENEDGSDTFSRFAAFGASANAFTSNEVTAYLFSATENYYENLSVLLSFVTSPYFTDETVEKEMGIITQELKMYEDNPYSKLYSNLLKALYVKHNVRIDVGGTVDSIRKIDKDVLYRCYSTFYNLNNMMLTLAGDFEPDKVMAVLGKVLSPSKDVRVETLVQREPKRVNQRRVEESFPVSNPLFIIGLKETDTDEKEGDALRKQLEHEIILNMLFGKSSRFYNENYEKGIINDTFQTSVSMSKTYGYASFFGEAKNPDKVFSLIKREMKNADLTKADFERSKRLIYAQAVQWFNSVSDICEVFTELSLMGADMLSVPELIESITLSDIEKRFNRSYNTKYMAISIVNPKEESEE